MQAKQVCVHHVYLCTVFIYSTAVNQTVVFCCSLAFSSLNATTGADTGLNDATGAVTRLNDATGAVTRLNDTTGAVTWLNDATAGLNISSDSTRGIIAASDDDIIAVVANYVSFSLAATIVDNTVAALVTVGTSDDAIITALVTVGAISDAIIAMAWAATLDAVAAALQKRREPSLHLRGDNSIIFIVSKCSLTIGVSYSAGSGQLGVLHLPNRAHEFITGGESAQHFSV